MAWLSGSEWNLGFGPNRITVGPVPTQTTPDGRGTKQSPVDLATATMNSQLVAPGTTVWIGPGTYQVGSLQPHESIRGTKDKPITHLVLKSNCTYHPNPASKRGVDVGFHGSPNTDIRIEDNYFTVLGLRCGQSSPDGHGAGRKR